MINLTRILTGQVQPSDALRYGRGHGAVRTAADRRPVVVWNITRQCNLHCLHCYSESAPATYPGELAFEECLAVLDDLRDFGVPAVLLSGGEPLMHPRFFEIAQEARVRGLRLTLSTNGILISEEVARRLKALQFAYIGISLDGIGAVHDHFRGRQGAFDLAVRAFENCRAVGQKSGLRLTLTRQTVENLEQILDFIEEKEIQRVCFYHLVPTGRGASLVAMDHSSTRGALDTIFRRTEQWAERGDTREVLTVDQPADAAYTMLHLRDTNPGRLAEAQELLAWNGGGGNGSGVGIGNIDTQGNVHADQFWQNHSLGNVRETPFSQIWTSDDPLLVGLRSRRERLPDICRECRFLNVCGGGFRARAWHATGDAWAVDPGCYLNEAERLEGAPVPVGAC